MKSLLQHTIALLLVCYLLTGCSTGTKNVFNEEPIPVEHAQGFKLYQGEGYRRIDITNPWKEGEILNTYILIEKDAPTPAELPEGDIIRTPLTRSAVFSSVHCGLLEELGVLDAIGGVCDKQYIIVEELQQRITNGTVVDAGNSLTPNVEKIIDLNPDAILVSSFENAQNERIERIGIPIFECCDYMETTPLGRVEWVRIFGWLYGCEEIADSLYNTVCREYTQTCQQIDSVQHKPSVITERRIGSVWYMPGGNSYMATMLKDAGAFYPWHDYNQTGSIPLSFETVFDKGSEADFWLIKYNDPYGLTYSKLQSDYALNSEFKAFKEGKIYGCNTHYIKYYEETPFHPERLLLDLAAIFHPELFPSHTPRYFHPLAQ